MSITFLFNYINQAWWKYELNCHIIPMCAHFLSNIQCFATVAFEYMQLVETWHSICIDGENIPLATAVHNDSVYTKVSLNFLPSEIPGNCSGTGKVRHKMKERKAGKGKEWKGEEQEISTGTIRTQQEH